MKVKSLLSIILIGLTTVSIAQTMDAEQIYKKVNGAVVQIYAYDSYSKMISQGSGVVLNDKGWIVTNYHVYNGSDKMVIRHNGKTIEYTSIIGLDADKDILILKIADHTFPFIAMGNSDLLNVGQKVYAIGSPEGFENTISEGIVSGLRSYAEHTKNYIQISAPISHGSSGGAVVNGKGELIGISTLSVVEGQNINFAIPVNEIMKVYKKEGVTQSDLTISDLFYQGNKAMDDDNYYKAIIDYQSLIAMNQTYPAVYYNLAQCYNKTKYYQQAINSYDKAIELDPTFYDAYYNRGDAKKVIGDYQGAINDFNSAIALRSDDPYPYLDRGIAKASLQNYYGAIDDANKAIQLDPNLEVAYVQRGLYKGNINDYYGAIDDDTKAIYLNPKYAEAYANRGLLKLLVKDNYAGCLDLTNASELGSEAAYTNIQKFCR